MVVRRASTRGATLIGRSRGLGVLVAALVMVGVVGGVMMGTVGTAVAQVATPPVAPADGAGLLPGLDPRLVGAPLVYGTSAVSVAALRDAQSALEALTKEQADLHQRQVVLAQTLSWLGKVQQAAALRLVAAEANLRRLTALVYTQANTGWQESALLGTDDVLESGRVQTLGGSLGEQLVAAKREARIARKAASAAAADFAQERVNVDARLEQVEQVELPNAQRNVADLSVHAAQTLAGAAVQGLDIPLATLDAYLRASTRLATERPACGLQWWMLAGIGRVESNHGRYGGAQPGPHGDVTPRITGIPLDGSAGVGMITDTDRGLWDGDTRWDRAVGPMQFIPSTWRHYEADANGDGRADPNNVYDAALGAGRYLCTAAGHLGDDASLTRAYLAYNHSDVYAAEVLNLARSYEQTGLPHAA
jgi:membrane-bound lytic murein transglycosylase B